MLGSCWGLTINSPSSLSPKISVRNKLITTDQSHGLSVSPPPTPHPLVGCWVRLQDLKPLPTAASSFQEQWKGRKAVHRKGKLLWGWQKGGREKGQGLRKCERWTRRRRPENPNTALLTPQANANNLVMCEVPGVRGPWGRAYRWRGAQGPELLITQQMTQDDSPMVLPVTLRAPTQP